MFKLFTTFIICQLLVISAFTQIRFEQGYFIDSTGTKIECLIKNYEWKNNPDGFKYKLIENGPENSLTIKTVKEFGVVDQFRYVRSSVKIDRSREEIDHLSKLKNPVYQTEVHFLKVLTEGKAILYSYHDEEVARYFFSIDNSAPEQLVYKKFYNEPSGTVGENFAFRQQLWTNVNCGNAPLSSVQNVKYYRDDLENYFKKYNECTGSTNKSYTLKKKIFHLWILPGLNYSSFGITNSAYPSYDIKFDNKLSMRYGIMGEVTLPVNKNKWSFLIESAYQSFFSKKIGNNIKYKSIEFVIGFRYRMFLNDQIILFVNAQIVPFFGSTFNSVAYIKNEGELKIIAGNCLAFGTGFQYKRVNAEIRLYTNRPLFTDRIYYDNSYRRLSILFGFRIF